MVLVFLELQLKRTIRHLPFLLTGAVLLFLLTGSIAFLSSKKLYGDAVTGLIRIGVVYKGLAVDERLFISALSDQATLAEMTQFNETGEAQGRLALEQGRIQALLLIPEDMVHKIRVGLNEPARIILNQNQVLEAKLFKTLTEAGAKTLSASQGALYASYETFREQGVDKKGLDRLTADINERYLALGLGRNRSFALQTVQATEELDALTYFLSSWMVLFLLLLGMLEAFVMRPLSQGMKTALDIQGLGCGLRVLTDWFRLFLLQLLFLSLILGVWQLAAPALRYRPAFEAALIPAVLALAFALAAFILFIYTAAEDLLSGMLLLFAGAFLMVFLSGGFLPSAFLPAWIRDLQWLVPATGWISLMGDLFSGSPRAGALVPTILFGLVFLSLAWAAETARRRRRRGG